MGKTCVICNRPSGMYPLCREHLQMKAAGEVIKCPDCRTWHLAEEKCPKCYNTQDENNDETASTIKCLLCQNDSEGQHFCRSCYAKYHDKRITVIISKCHSAEIIDEYGNKQYKCANGMYVRSTQEKIIFDELYRRNIKCEYEKPFPYKKDDGTVAELHPDFYLPELNLYIEHWGIPKTDPQYAEMKKYKERIFNAHKARVVGTTPDDLKDIESVIGRILLEYTPE